MTDKQFKIFNKHAGTYCTAKVKSPGEDTFKNTIKKLY